MDNLSISDALTVPAWDLEKAREMLETITTEYFRGNLSEGTGKERKTEILIDHARYGTYTEIAFDYVFKALGAVRELQEQINAGL